MGWVLAVLLACGRGEVDVQAPAPRPGMPAIGLLRAPFSGEFPTDNVFDHVPGPRPPGEGELVGCDGRRAIGTRGHRGYDWPLPPGTPVLAPADGEVVLAGSMPPFACPLLGKQVNDQLAVVLRHTAPDGTVWETGSHHLSQVDVTAGQTVKAGEVVGRSGASGCARGPHLHFQVERVDGEAHRPMDPFGWSGTGADPWSTGEPSPWLWIPGGAPRWFREQQVEELPSGQAVAVRSLRYQGWQDERAPEQESVEIVAGPGEVGGWTLEAPGGLRWSLPPGESLAEQVVLRVHSGQGRETPTVRFWGSPGPVWPDEGGALRLVRPDGSTAQTVRYGLGSRRVPSHQPEPGRPSCVTGDLGCVVVDVPGPVSEPAWSPDGRRLAAVAGVPGRRLLVIGETGEALHVAAELPDAAHPRWLSPDIVVFDALDEGGERRPAYLVPGLRAAWALDTADLGGAAEVRDARQGLLLLAVRRPAATDLWIWRLGDAEARALTTDRRDELGGCIDDAGDHVVYAAAGVAWRVPVTGGTPENLGPVIDPDVLVAPWGEGVVWIRAGGVQVVDGAGARSTLAEGVSPWPASGRPSAVAGTVLVVRGGVVALGEARSLDLPEVPQDALHADVWSDGSILRIAYTRSDSPDRSARLAVIEVPMVR